MLRRITRLAAVPTTTFVALGTLFAAPPAEALGSCTSPLPMAGVAAGAFTSSDQEDFWRYEAAGTTTIRVVTAIGVFARVWSGACGTVLCATGASVSTCTINWTGPVVIEVDANSSNAAYALTATSTVPTSSSCNRVNTTGVCVDLTVGGVVEEEIVYNVTTTPVATHAVGGWLDAYRFPLPTGGSVVAPCVVLAVNSAGANPCAQAGGTFVSRTLTLVNQSVVQPEVVRGAPLATVRVCDATLTATVLGFGVEQFPVLSTC